MKKIGLLIFSLLICLFSVELILRLSKKLKTYTEINFNEYQSAYDASGINHLYTWPKNELMNPSQTEFDYSYQTNHLGFVFKQDLDSCDQDSTYIFLGDSFVFGVGAPQDSSLPVLLENKTDLTMINAGIPGSDPFFQARLIDSIFAPRGFNKYIIMINFSDVYDFVIRGGEERFIDSQEVRYRKAPWIESPYRHSYIVRAIIHGICRMDYALVSQAKLEALKKEAINAYGNLLAALASKYELHVVLLPYPRQYAQNHTSQEAIFNFETVMAIGELLKEQKVSVYDLNSSLKSVLNDTNYTKYSWPLDGHYNAAGYTLLADILEENKILYHP